MLQIFFAIVAGVLTIAAPCILPLLPIIIGTSVGQKSKTRPLFIVCGFMLTFTLASAALTYLVQHTGLQPNVIRNGGIFLLAIFGVCMIWPEPFELFMARFNRIFTKAGSLGYAAGKGNWGGFLLGLTLGIVWTPCAGPVLGSILTLIAVQKEFATASILLFSYSLGASIPMLLIAYGGQYVTTQVNVIARYTRQLQCIFGIIIILFAIALYFNYDTKFYALLLNKCSFFNPRF